MRVVQIGNNGVVKYNTVDRNFYSQIQISMTKFGDQKHIYAPYDQPSTVGVVEVLEELTNCFKKLSKMFHLLSTLGKTELHVAMVFSSSSMQPLLTHCIKFV